MAQYNQMKASTKLHQNPHMCGPLLLLKAPQQQKWTTASSEKKDKCQKDKISKCSQSKGFWASPTIFSGMVQYNPMKIPTKLEPNPHILVFDP